MLPSVEVIVPVHDIGRPLGRAVGSVLRSVDTTQNVRLTVVCHNIRPEQLRPKVPAEFRDQIRWLELNDGIHSPAGPKNLGLETTDADYVTFLDSDDFLEPGAISAWLKCAERWSASAVIAPEVHQNGRRIRTPPIRPFRRSTLHPIRDRLAYRTAPLGLFDTAALKREEIRFAQGLVTGEDHDFSLRLWFSGERVVYGRGCPQYVVCDDAESRITRSIPDLVAEFQALRHVITSAWFLDLSAAERTAISTKLVRVHVFGVVARRANAGIWTESDAAEVSNLLNALDDVGPAFDTPLSIADRKLIDGLRGRHLTREQILTLANRRRQHFRPTSLVSRSLRGQFSSEGPLKMMVASALL